VGTYNTLNIERQCPRCKKPDQASIQFKYGDTWQIKYHVGEMISWGGNDIGSAKYNKVTVYGVAQNDECKYCGMDLQIEFDIYIEGNRIQKVCPMENYDVYLGNDGDFSVVLD